jgi:hypothetical protein
MANNIPIKAPPTDKREPSNKKMNKIVFGVAPNEIRVEMSCFFSITSIERAPIILKALIKITNVSTHDAIGIHVAVVVVERHARDVGAQAEQVRRVLVAVVDRGRGHVARLVVLHVLAVQRQRQRQSDHVELGEDFAQAELVGGVAVGTERGGRAVLVVVEVVDAGAEGPARGIAHVEGNAALQLVQREVVLDLEAFAVDGILQHVVAAAAEERGGAALLRVAGRHALGVDVTVPDHVAHRHPRLLHLAREGLQAGYGDRDVTDVGKIQPHRFLVEVVVHVLVGRAAVGAVAARDLDAGFHFGIDLGERTETGTDALAVLVAAAGEVGLAVDIDRFLAHAHITRELRALGPAGCLTECDEILLLDHVLRRVLLLASLARQVSTQLGVLRRRDRAICLEHVEQLRIDRTGIGLGGPRENQTSAYNCFR